MLLGAVGAVAGIFGMNFEVPFFQSGGLGFWSVIGVLILFTIAAMAVARMRTGYERSARAPLLQSGLAVTRSGTRRLRRGWEVTSVVPIGRASRRVT